MSSGTSTSPSAREGKALARLRAEVGMVVQSFNLFAHKTVLQNVSVAQVEVRRRGLPFEVFVVLALGCCASAFICEAPRSGINTVPTGQG